MWTSKALSGLEAQPRPLSSVTLGESRSCPDRAPPGEREPHACIMALPCTINQGVLTKLQPYARNTVYTVNVIYLDRDYLRVRPF